MGKPNRKTTDAFFDVFADMDPDDQEIAMRVLEQTHRLTKRNLVKPKPESEPAAGETIPLREVQP